MKRPFLFLCSFLFCISTHAQYAGLEWAFTQGSTSFDLTSGIEEGPAGNIYVAGFFLGTVDFDPGPGVENLTTASNNEDIFIQKLDPSGNLIWVVQLEIRTFSDTVKGELLQVDNSGNVYLTGRFSGTGDFDPGPNVFNLSAAGGGPDIFIVKFDPSGNFLWATRTGTDRYEELAGINIDASGNVICVGGFAGMLDADPGSGTFTLDYTSGDVFIQKLDPSGNFIWAKNIGTTSYNYMGSVTTDNQDNVIVSGTFGGTIDMDPGPGVFSLTSVSNTQDFFTLKLDANGDFQWAKQISSSSYLWRISSEVDPTGNVYVNGSFGNTADFDPGSGTAILTAGNNGGAVDGFIQKIDAQGNVAWTQQYGTGSASYANVEPLLIRADDSGTIYICGAYYGEVDFDPGPGIDLYGSVNSSGYYMAKLNTAGNYLGSQFLDNGNYRLISDLSIGNGDNLYLTGNFFIPFDIDPGPGSVTLTPSGGEDMFVAKWSQDSCSNLAAIIDSSLDVTCNSQGFSSGYGLGGKGAYTYAWNTTPVGTDSFAYFPIPGIYELTVSDTAGCSRTSNVMIGGPTNLTGQDLVVNITSTGFRTGFPSTIWLDAYNDGCTSVSGEVRLVLDPFLTFDSSSPQPDTIIGNTLIWNVSNMVYDSPHFMAQVEVTVSTQAMIGDQVCLDAEISPKTNDNNTKNNVRDFCMDVVNSYDPNDKQVSPQGVCDEGYISNDESLTYTVRFQNTGNADAINIFILDSLNTNLDINSVKIVGQSHKPMITEVLPDRVLKFRFDNIHLADSASDEPNSHGYVMFEVSPLPNLSMGTELKNKAGIYFDFNEPIITNTVLNTLIDVVPTQDTGFVQASACNSYDLNGRTYTASGEYFQRIGGVGSCDSVVSLSLTLQPLDTSITLIGKTLTVSEGGAHGLNVSYQWVDCANGNAPISGATSQSYTPESDGNYAVIVSRDNCSEMSACTSVSTVGIDPDFQSEINYYPNPTKGLLQVDLGKYYEAVEVEVVNIVGQSQLKGHYSSTDKLSLELPPQAGFYFLRIKADDKEAVVKILKRE